ncbi:MAG: PQQ-binding-like beta-propeller repeat protein [Planctomycetes bacterium]|nr:PQQ-binding-like beta-propeller repeat protein [Planctomycetota bacterium]
MAMFAIAAAIAETFQMLFWFSGGWFVVYALLAPWLQTRLLHWRAADNPALDTRMGPVYVSHILFSLVLMNPCLLLLLVFQLDRITESDVRRLILGACYVLLLPLAWDDLVLGFLGRWRWLRWLRCRAPFRRVVPTSLLISALGLSGGYVAVQMKDTIPAVVRSFPLRPKSYTWKVKTGAKPLVDGSVAAEPARMLVDDRYVHLYVNDRARRWVTVDRTRHAVVADEGSTLAYVQAGDGGPAWHIEGHAADVICRRPGGDPPRRVPLPVAADAVFLGRQVKGLIVGADPSQGRLHALDPAAGTVRWTATAPAADGNGDRRIGSVADTAGVIAVGLWMSRVWAVDAETGRTLWTYAERGYGNSMHVVASDEAVVAFSRSDRAYAFDPRTGQQKWAKKVGDLAGGYGEGNVWIGRDRLVFRDDKTVTCLDPGTGDTLWQRAFGSHYSGGICGSGGDTVACTSDRALMVLDLQTGRESFATKFPVGSGIEYGWHDRVEQAPARIYTQAAGAPGRELYVFTTDGVLWCLRP